MMKTAAIVLAAGGGSRYKGNQFKLLEQIHGTSIVKISVQKMIMAGFSPVIVVIGSHSSEVRAEIGDLDISLVENKNWLQGQSFSLKKGLEMMPDGCSGVCIALADMPFVKGETITQLDSFHHKFPDSIIVPTFQGKRGNPVIFPQCQIKKLFQAAHSDQGGRSLIGKEATEWIEVNDQYILKDIDTVEDYINLQVE